MTEQNNQPTLAEGALLTETELDNVQGGAGAGNTGSTSTNPIHTSTGTSGDNPILSTGI